MPQVLHFCGYLPHLAHDQGLLRSNLSLVVLCAHPCPSMYSTGCPLIDPVAVIGRRSSADRFGPETEGDQSGLDDFGFYRFADGTVLYALFVCVGVENVFSPFGFVSILDHVIVVRHHSSPRNPTLCSRRCKDRRRCCMSVPPVRLSAHRNRNTSERLFLCRGTRNALAGDDASGGQITRTAQIRSVKCGFGDHGFAAPARVDIPIVR